MTQPFLPYGRQSIDADDIAAVTRVLHSDYLTTGPEIPAFEAEFAAAVDAPFAVACNSATAALHLALAGLGVGGAMSASCRQSPFSRPPTPRAIAGRKSSSPMSMPQTGLLTPDTLSEALHARAGGREAVLPVHLGRGPCDMAGD
jgi:dTDP-4-amino-4,6-dideoxygalactose transaminase